MANKNGYEYDVSLSFAGENRAFVREVAESLISKNIKVFYDEYEQTTLWGKNLYTHLDDIYRNKSRYCVIFISQHYKEKLWTNHERESAQARAFKENAEYILPFRFDNTEIPGIKDTTGYLSAKTCNPQQLADAIEVKLGKIKKEIVNPHEPIKEGSKSRYFAIEPGIFVDGEGNAEIRIRKSDFFASRLSKAFPGVRGLRWFEDPKLINDRLQILLKEPLIFNKFPGKEEYEAKGIMGGISNPIWWFRGGSSMPIEAFEKLSETKCLMGHYEYELDRIAVYKDSVDYRNFIYVEVKAEQPVERIEEDISSSIKYQLDFRSYAVQEYAMYDGIPIKREEYDDEAAIIDGHIVNLHGKAKVRIRYLTKFNFIICAQSSVYNTNESDKVFGAFMDKVLRQEGGKLEDFIHILQEIQPEKHYKLDFY